MDQNSNFGLSGFNSLPGGYRWYLDGTCSYISKGATFWTSSENGNSEAWTRLVYYDSTQVGRYSNNKGNGFSVRCVKD